VAQWKLTNFGFQILRSWCRAYYEYWTKRNQNFFRSPFWWKHKKRNPFIWGIKLV